MTLDELNLIKDLLSIDPNNIHKTCTPENCAVIKGRWIINREIKLRTMNVTGKDD